LSVFVLKTGAQYVFDIILNKKISDFIDRNIVDWVETNPNDEWILGFQKRNFEEKNYEMMVSNANYDEIKDDSDKIEEIFGMLLVDNYSTFTLIFAIVLLIILSKIFISFGLASELVLGLTSGFSIHALHFIYFISLFLKELYFDSSLKIDITKIIVANNKIPIKILAFIPIVFVSILSTIRMYSYSRIIGEWIVDINLFGYYGAILLGFYLIQTLIDILCASKKNPGILFLVLFYFIMAIFV
jgi:hypothetical protein